MRQLHKKQQEEEVKPTAVSSLLSYDFCVFCRQHLRAVTEVDSKLISSS